MAKKNEVKAKKEKKTKNASLLDKVPIIKDLRKSLKETEIQKDMAKFPSFNTPIAKYQFTPSYIKLGNRYGSIIKLVNVAGMNTDKEFSWAVDLLPNIDLEGVKGYLISKDNVISERAERVIQEKEINDLEKAVRNNGISSVSSEKEKATKLGHLQDIQELKNHLDEKEHIVDVELTILITADSADKISQQITRLQRFYDRRINGVELTSAGGKQEEYFKELFEKPKSSRFNYTFSTRVFAGMDNMIRKGIDDKTGWGIGMIADSYTSGVAMLDFDNSFTRDNPRLQGQILIASSKNATISGYTQFGDISASSAWGQLIANQAMTNLPRPRHTYHIVLNDFDYYQSLEKGEDKYVVPAQYMLPDMEYHDMSYGGLNIVEGFGDINLASDIYDQKTATIAYIFYLLSGRVLTKGAKTTLQKALQSFYLDNYLWDKDAIKKDAGHMARFMNLEDHTQVNTLGDFTNKMSTYVSNVNNAGTTEKERDEVKDVYKILEVAITQRPDLFNTYSTLPNRVDETKLQHYYDLSRLSTEQAYLEMQFLNVFPYILASAKPNDIVVIHGLNQLTLETWEFVEEQFMKTARSQKIRFIYILDTIGSETIKEQTVTKPKHPKIDLFNSRGTLYNDIEGDFDVTILGMMTNDELNYYEKLVSAKGQLPANIRNSLNAVGNQNRSKFQIRRPADTSSNTVIARFGI